MGKNFVTETNLEIADGKYVIKSNALRELDVAYLSYLMNNSTFLNDSKLLFNKPSEFILNLRYYPLMLSNYLDSVDYTSWATNSKEHVVIGGKTYQPAGNDYLDGVDLQKNRRLSKLYKIRQEQTLLSFPGIFHVLVLKVSCHRRLSVLGKRVQFVTLVMSLICWPLRSPQTSSWPLNCPSALNLCQVF